MSANDAIAVIEVSAQIPKQKLLSTKATLMKCSAAIVMLFALTANWIPPTREEVEIDAQKFIAKCHAEHLLSVIVERPTGIKIKPLKKANQRTEADLAALRCVGRQYSSAIDFRPLAQLLLTMQDAT